MAEGKHCPECGKDIGYWAVAWGLFSIRCPHCRLRLKYTHTPRMNRLITFVAMGCVLVGLAPAFVAGVMVLRFSNPLVGLAVGGVVWVASAFALGLAFQIAITPVLRRTQTLTFENAQNDADDEDSW